MTDKKYLTLTVVYNVTMLLAAFGVGAFGVRAFMTSPWFAIPAVLSAGLWGLLLWLDRRLQTARRAQRTAERHAFFLRGLNQYGEKEN